jgi:DNA-binding PadR family transcriptional regulator
MLMSSSISSIERSEPRIVKRINEKIIKNFMDTIILAELRTGPISGYDAITFIHTKYGFLVSSGTIYSMLYSLERSGLIEGINEERKRVYKLTEKGAKTLEIILRSQDKIKFLINNILKA